MTVIEQMSFIDEKRGLGTLPRDVQETANAIVNAVLDTARKDFPHKFFTSSQKDQIDNLVREPVNTILNTELANVSLKAIERDKDYIARELYATYVLPHISDIAGKACCVSRSKAREDIAISAYKTYKDWKKICVYEDDAIRNAFDVIPDPALEDASLAAKLYRHSAKYRLYGKTYVSPRVAHLTKCILPEASRKGKRAWTITCAFKLAYLALVIFAMTSLYFALCNISLTGLTDSVSVGLLSALLAISCLMPTIGLVLLARPLAKRLFAKLTKHDAWNNDYIELVQPRHYELGEDNLLEALRNPKKLSSYELPKKKDLEIDHYKNLMNEAEVLSVRLDEEDKWL